MKKVILYSLLTVLSVMFYECGKSEEAPGETYTFQFSEEDWAVPVAGANKNVPLEAPGEWTAEVVYVSGSGKWLNATPLKGKAGKSQINLSVGKNTSYDEAREATLTVTCGTESKSIKITQDTQEGVVIEQQLFNLKPGDTLIAVKVSANVGYEHTIDKSAEKWILPAEAKSSMKDSTIRFQVLANDTDKERTGTITFSPTKGNDVTVTVKQACRAEADAAAVEPVDGMYESSERFQCAGRPDRIAATRFRYVLRTVQRRGRSDHAPARGRTETKRADLLPKPRGRPRTAVEIPDYRNAEDQRMDVQRGLQCRRPQNRRLSLTCQLRLLLLLLPARVQRRGNNGDWSKMATGPNTDVAPDPGTQPAVRTSAVDPAIHRRCENEIAKGALVFFAGDLNEPSHLDWQADTKDLWGTTTAA